MISFRVSDDKHAERHRPSGSDPLNLADFVQVQPGVPSYAPTSLANPWDASLSLYNSKGSSMHVIRSKLAKVAQNTAGIHILHMSDSTGVGYPGQNPLVQSKSVPFRMAKTLTRLTGNPYVTTGLIFAGAGVGILSDEWVFTGTWSVSAGTVVSYTAGTASITTPQPCTNIEVYYSDASPSFTYSVDGGAPVSVATTATAVIKKLTVSNLTYGTHTIVMNMGVYSLLAAFRCWTAGLNQIHIHNFSYGGSKANNTNMDKTTDWSNLSSGGGSVGLGSMANQIMAASGLTFDVAGVCIGSNDLFSGTKDPDLTKTGVENMLGYAPDAAHYLIHELPIVGTDTTIFDTFGTNMFAIADQYDCPLFDWNDYAGGITAYLADGQAGPDSVHPIFSHQNLIGTWIANGLVQRQLHGNENFPGIAGMPGGRYRLSLVSGAYPHRPPVPAGDVDYVGSVQPTDWLPGDSWDQTA